MKKLLLLTLIPLSVNGQSVDSSRIKQAGVSLIKYQSKMGLGYVAQAGGVALMAGGIANVSKVNGKPDLFYLGSGIFFLGLIINLTAQHHLSKAGVHLKNNTISIDINKK